MFEGQAARGSLSNPAETGILQRYYDVIHDDINFYYQRKGNQQIISEWIKQVQNLYLSKNAFELAAVLKIVKCYLDHFVRI